MPDTLDYEWLRWLTEHPDEWTDDDASAARFMISEQRRAIEELHPNDVRGRQSAQAVVDGLEAALRSYLARRP